MNKRDRGGGRRGAGGTLRYVRGNYKSLKGTNLTDAAIIHPFTYMYVSHTARWLGHATTAYRSVHAGNKHYFQENGSKKKRKAKKGVLLKVLTSRCQNIAVV